MSPDLQQALVTYAVPALIMGYLELRRRRIQSKEHAVDADQNRRVSDFEMHAKFRDELWERWKEVNEENSKLRDRLDVVERRLDIMTELVVRHGLPVPEWVEDRA